MVYSGYGLPGRTMPGNSFPGEVCEGPQGPAQECSNAPTHKVQGATDSFGCEWLFFCDSHYSEFQNRDRRNPGDCDWCKKHDDDRATTRDPDEGMGGPVYWVCRPCISRMHAAQAEEYANDQDYLD